MGSFIRKNCGKKNARPEQNGNNKKNIEAPSHNSYLTFDDNFSLTASRNFQKSM